MYKENPWSPEEQDAFRKPKRTWAGLSPKETELVTRGAVGRAQCPDCWRWHIDGFRNTQDGHCWSCHLEIQAPGSTKEAWDRFEGEYRPTKKEEDRKAGLKLMGSKQKGKP